jgi:hypothetical protein
MEIPLTTIQDALREAGLPEDSLGDLRPQTAFARAVKDLRENRAIDRVKTDAKSDVITFQFTRKSLDAANVQIDFNYEATCTLDTTTGAIDCPNSPSIEAHARAMFSHALNHRTTSDVTRLVQRLFEQHADLFPINPKKGVAYFVPEKYRSFSAQMEDFLSALGGSLLRFPVPSGTESGNRSVRESVDAGLLAMAEELKTAREAWNESTRHATMDHQLARLQIVQHKAEAYATLLGDRQAQTLALLAQHKAELIQKINEISSLKEEKKTAPQADGTRQTLFSETRPEEPATLPW